MIIKCIELTTFFYLNKIYLKQHKPYFCTKNPDEISWYLQGNHELEQFLENDYRDMLYPKNSYLLKMIFQSF